MAQVLLATSRQVIDVRKMRKMGEYPSILGIVQRPMLDW